MPIQFHWYGFIVGLSIVIGSQLIEKQLQKRNFSVDLFYKLGFFVLFFAVIGARAWHVATDFHLYTDNLLSALYIWRGGLSIFGGVLGGIVGLYCGLFILSSTRLLSLKKKQFTAAFLLDSAVFGLPVGQAIGRVANYLNQELYGVPSDGFFKIYIDEAHRLPGYEHVAYYHPLFLYELLATGGFAGVLYWLASRDERTQKKLLPELGTGKLFVVYVLFYSIVRFFLDFLRIDKTFFGESFLGINQVFLLVVILGCSFLLLVGRKQS